MRIVSGKNAAMLAVALAVSMPPLILDRVRAEDSTDAPQGTAGRVDRQVEQWWPRPDEKRFDEIGWAADIRQARRLSKEHGRPVFLFTMDGHVNIGRC